MMMSLFGLENHSVMEWIFKIPIRYSCMMNTNKIQKSQNFDPGIILYCSDESISILYCFQI